MKRTVRASTLGLAAGFLLVTANAMAAPPKVPVSFDPSLGAQPARTQQKLAALEAKLPATFALPASLASAKTGTLTLDFFPETLAGSKRASRRRRGRRTSRGVRGQVIVARTRASAATWRSPSATCCRTRRRWSTTHRPRASSR